MYFQFKKGAGVLPPSFEERLILESINPIHPMNLINLWSPCGHLFSKMMGQIWYMNIMKKFRLKINPEGCCYGMSITCMTYILNNQISTFFKLLNFIYQVWYENSPYSTNEQKQQLDEKRKTILIIANHYSTVYTQSDHRSTLSISDQNKRNSFLDLQATACEELKISREEYKLYRRFINAVYLLLGDVSLIQVLDQYEELAKQCPHSTINPLPLLHYGLEERHFRYQKTDFCVFYGTRQKLILFLNELKNILDSFSIQNDLAFNLGTGEHSIILAYLPGNKSSHFQLIDPNKLGETQIMPNTIEFIAYKI